MGERVSTLGVTPVDGQPGSSQRIGRGRFVGAFIITPANTATTLTNLQISTELAAQIAAGTLPAPTTDAGGNVNTIYMVDFPPGYTISVNGQQSCVTFCSVYDTMTVGGKSVGVCLVPEIATGACAGGCGTGPSPGSRANRIKLTRGMSPMSATRSTRRSPASR